MHEVYENVLRVVERVTGKPPVGSSDTHRKALCPVHADDKPSMSLRWDEEKEVVGVTCFAGCTFTEITEALGLEKADFRVRWSGGKSGPGRGARTRRQRSAAPEQPGDSAPAAPGKGDREVKRYPYVDEAGNVLYYNIRFEPKAFRMANAKGEMKALPKDLVRVPYRLPEVLDAIADGQTVYWVEGEKDADRMWDEGHPATTSAGGGLAPVPREWAQWFSGASVIAVRDKDKTGHTYITNVVKMLTNEARSVRIAEPATPQLKSDVSDHLDAGYRIDQVVFPAVRMPRRTQWSMATLLATAPEPLRWVIPGVIPEGLTLLVGAPKVGKSWWNLNMIAALASGDPLQVFGWGQPLDPCPSLYLALEDPHRRIYDRMNKVTKDLNFDARKAGDVWLDIDPLARGGREMIERWLDANPTSRLVAVDVLAKVRPDSGESQTMYQADYDAVGALKDIADDRGIGVVVTHHDRKKGDEDFVSMVSGTKGVTGAADTILYLTRKRGSDEGELKSESRDVEACTYTVQFAKEFGRWQILDRRDIESDDGPGGSDQPKMPLADEIQRVIMARGASDLKKVAEIIDVAEATVRKAAAKARDQGQLVQRDNGLWEVPDA